MQTANALESAPLAFEPQRKNVMGSHEQTAHVWAQGRIASGRSSDGRVFFENGAIYSHGYHFVIARISEHKWNGRRVVFWNNERYSVSTSKHQNLASRALWGLVGLRIDVESYSGGRLTAENIKATLYRMARHNEQESAEFIAFAAIAAPEMKLTNESRREAFRARVLREDATAEKKAAAEKLATLKFNYRHNRPACYMREEYCEIPAFELARDSQEWNAWKAGDKAGAVERVLTEARSARLAFSKAALPRYKATTSAIVKHYSPIATAWRALETELRDHETKAQRMAQVASIVDAIASKAIEWRAYDSTFLGNAICDAAKYGLIDAIPILQRRMAEKQLEREIDALDCVARTEKLTAWQRRFEAGRREKGRTVDEWRAGAGYASYYESTETLVRRKGDRLETSRGAEAPFAQAVAIFVKAQQCRAAGVEWRPNGERFKAGYFELDSIDATGRIRIGCHTIEFSEMLALAVQEVPALVTAAFPVPALV